MSCSRETQEADDRVNEIAVLDLCLFAIYELKGIANQTEALDVRRHPPSTIRRWYTNQL